MKKIVASVIICLSLLIFSLFTALLFVDYNAAYQNFLANIQVNTIAHENSKITIKKFPIPHFVIDNIKDEGKLELNDIEIRFSFWSLIKFKPQINSIKASNVKVNLSSNNFNLVDHDKLITNILSKYAYKINLEIANLALLDNNNNTILLLDDFSLLGEDGAFNSNFQGDIRNVGRLSGGFNTKGDLVTLQFKLTNEDYTFELFENYKDYKLLNGGGEWQVSKISDLLVHQFPEAQFLFSKINPNELARIKFDILPTIDLLQLQNLTISSNSISGGGNIDINKNAAASSVINLNFSKIDLKSFLSSSNTSSPGIITSTNSILSDKLIDTNISIDKIYISDQQTIDNVKFSSNFEQGILIIKDFSGQIQSGGEFKIAGNVTKNSYRNIFDGKIYLQHGNLNSILSVLGYDNLSVTSVTPFVFASNLKFTLIDLYLQDLLLKTGNTKLTGNISSKFIGSQPRIDIFLNFSSIDLDSPDYPIISPLVDFAKSLTENTKDAEYLNKFIPIRRVPYLGNFDLTFNKLEYKGINYGDVNVLMNVSPGKIQVHNLEINTVDDYLSTSYELIADELKPQLKAVINEGYLHVKFLTPSSLLYIRDILLNKFNLDKVSVSLDCLALKLYQNDLIFDKLQFSLLNEGILLKIFNLGADWLSGKLQGEGSILLEPHTLNFVYALNSIDLAKLAKILPDGLLNTSGGASVNGVLITNGDTLEKLLYNLYTQSSFVAKEVIIPKFSIDSFIENINKKNYDLKAMPTDLKNALETGETQVSTIQGNIELAKGIINIKDTTLQTKLSAATISAIIDIYNFTLNLSSEFSFYMLNSLLANNNADNKPIKFNIKATGTIFEPQKTADIDQLMKLLQTQQPVTTKN